MHMTPELDCMLKYKVAQMLLKVGVASRSLLDLGVQVKGRVVSPNQTLVAEKSLPTLTYFD